MPVYVDHARNPFRGHLMCHMVADTLDELHWMAEAVGMQRRWFQPVSFPHYDLPQDRRAAAVRLGAIEVDRRGIATIMRRLRREPAFAAALDVERAHHKAMFG